MATKKQGLQKDVFAIFGDATLPRDFRRRRPSADGPAPPDGRPKRDPEGRKAKRPGGAAGTATQEPVTPHPREGNFRTRMPIRKHRPERRIPPPGRPDKPQDEEVVAKSPPPTEVSGPEQSTTEVKAEPEVSVLPVEANAATVAEEAAASEQAGPPTASLTTEMPKETEDPPCPGPRIASDDIEVGQAAAHVDVSNATVESPPMHPAADQENDEGDAEAANSALDATQIIESPPKARPQAKPRVPKELPPLGSIAFLERVKKTMHCPKNFECCADRFIDICKAKVSRNGKEVICLEGRHCGCRFQSGTLLKRICNCSMRQHIAREYGY